MCPITNANTLAALQVAVLHEIKIDYPVCSINTQMEGIINQITQFVNDTDNHTPVALDEFKKLELFIATQRRSLTTKVSSAKKTADADERRADNDRKTELKRRQKEDAATDRKIHSDLKKKQKSTLLKLNKLLKKPKSPIAGKDDEKVLKWAMIGAKSNYAPVKKAARDATREAKKLQNEADAAARKLANAGKPKNGDYARFCKWFKADVEDIDLAGCTNKRDYNKQVWSDGIELAWGEWTDDDILWDDFKKSSDAPWNATK